jgi:16S rRNA G966 N2-methylase RsmD
VARHCAGARVLDAFCNQGAFALQAARAGAVEVLGLDSAEDAVAAARRNAERNGLKAEFQAANVFDWFNDPARGIEPLWDVIILDPPPFAKSRSALEGALRGYKEINLRAVKRLVPGGLLATYTCSHHMQDADTSWRRWRRTPGGASGSSSGPTNRPIIRSSRRCRRASTCAATCCERNKSRLAPPQRRLWSSWRRIARNSSN